MEEFKIYCHVGLGIVPGFRYSLDKERSAKLRKKEEREYEDIVLMD